MKIPDKLKAAIRQMPENKKDQLLLRLVAKDAALVDKLHYQLLEGGEDPSERREDLRAAIGASLAKSSQDRYYTPGYLLLDLRHWNARITEHVKATADKYGDVELRTWMLNEAIRLNGPMLARFPAHRHRSLTPYLIKRAIYLLKQLPKLHEDYWLELRDPIEAFLAYLHAGETTAYETRRAGVPKKLDEI